MNPNASNTYGKRSIASPTKPRKALEEGDFNVEVSHRFGNPTEEIVAEIGDWNPDLVVMGRRGVHGLERWIGSVSEHVLHHAKVAMLLVPVRCWCKKS
jgi:nucleotide-binding universal stress UspA family protein